MKALLNSIKICPTSILILTLVNFGCEQTNKNAEEFRTIDYGMFRVQIPVGWDTVSLKSIDSFSSAIITAKKDTLFIDYGMYSGSFDETPFLHPYSLKLHFDSLKEAYPKGMIFSKNYLIDRDQAIFSDEYYYYDTLQGRSAKFMLPKKIGTGQYGMHIASVNKYKMKLTLHAHDIDSSLHTSLVKTLRSVSFPE